MDGTAFVLDMRFPGQRYDAASGLNQNYFRDYEPATGRYGQSDPIGLDGGTSTYSYALSSPLGWIDPYGLEANQGCVATVTGVCAAVSGSLGFLGGGAIGGTAGSAVPIAGTAAGAIGGAELGGLAGASAGALAGNALGNAVCPDDKEEREKRCNENLERDMTTCTVLGNRFGKKAFAVCQQQAILRYGNCLSGRDEGIDAPLPPWGKL